MKNEEISTNSLAHTKWNCKYHIVFASKYRRKVFYEDKQFEIREILGKLCEWKGVKIVEEYVTFAWLAGQPKNALVHRQ